MKKDLIKIFLTQIEELKNEYTDLKRKARYKDLSDFGIEIVMSLRTRIATTIKRIAGVKSEYFNQLEEINKRVNLNDYKKLSYFIGPLDALYTDIQNDYLKSLSELIHGEIFSDYLEMAEHLLNEGYKDAAAVISGSTLEEHLRQLCDKNNILIQIQTKGGLRFKKADVVNADLARNNIYTKSEQKQVTAWLGIRNDAAHGNYQNYTKNEVKLLILGLRDFFIRNPA